MTLNRAEWERLRESRESLQKDLDRAEEREAELLQQLVAKRATVIRLRKEVRQTLTQTDEAVTQELDDMEEVDHIVEELASVGEEQGVLVEQQPLPFHDMVEMGSQDWDFIEGLPESYWEVVVSTMSADGILTASSS